MNSRSLKIILGLIYTFLITIVILLIIFPPYESISVSLKGMDEVNVEVFSKYEDEGIILYNGTKEIDSSEYEVSINDEVNYTKLGSYKLNYTVSYKDKEYKIDRNINVIDDEAPILTSSVNKVVKDSCTNKFTTKYTYSAIDNYDGDISKNVTIKQDDDNLVLSVKDSSSNEGSISLKIEYSSKSESSLKLVGNKEVFVPLNGEYKENGAIFNDGCGNTIKNNIGILGSVDTTKVGEYKLVYKINGKKKSRVVNVYEPNAKKDEKGKIIYLTFDDGPGAYTKQILDTLDKYGIKATFFVTHQFPSYESLIKTEYKKGHVVALHTYSHKYSVYNSVDTYLSDFNKMNDIIEKYTGSRSIIFRFPGGTSNTISKNYSDGIMTKLASQMTKDGYIYFDWNVSSGDASTGATSSKIYNNVVNGVKNCETCVVLMHDIHKATADALDDILKTLTSKGYKFGVITDATPLVQHKATN